MVDTHFLNKDFYAAVNDYNSAVLHGIVKIDIEDWVFSTVQSYQGSQIFRGSRDLFRGNL